MPQEREFKYVLKMEEDLRNVVATCAESHAEIHQGYLGGGPSFAARIRAIYSDDGKISHVFTFKRSCGGLVIELEQDVSAWDAGHLWGEATNVIRKVRYIMPHGHKCEVDLFYPREDIIHHYFAMAEIEVGPNDDQPGLPPCLRPYLLFAVPRDDRRFDNTNLGGIDYCRRLYQQLTQDAATCLPPLS